MESHTWAGGDGEEYLPLRERELLHPKKEGEIIMPCGHET